MGSARAHWQDDIFGLIFHMSIFENVLETEKLLEAKGVRLPVIPLEFGELYCSQFSFQKLVYA